MKVSKLIVKNIGPIEDVELELNLPLILLFGEIRQGKTTLLNAVRWVLGGSFPADIIRHGADDALIELQFEGGVISRSFYRSKSGDCKARDVVFVKDGKPVRRPVSELSRFLNPFLDNQDYLRNMTELERKKYFTEFFGVDTTDIDKQLFEATRHAEGLRSQIKACGHIDLTPVPDTNVEEIKTRLARAREEHNQGRSQMTADLEQLQEAYATACNEVEKSNEEGRRQNNRHELLSEKLVKAGDEVKRLETDLLNARHRHELASKEFEECPLLTLSEKPAPPQKIAEIKEMIRAYPLTSDGIRALEDELSTAAANDVRRQQLEQNKAKLKKREGQEKELSDTESKQRELRKARLAKLQGVTEKCGIKDLSFDDAGNFTYQGTDAGMLSTSQLMKLSAELSALYPEGFGLELIDRAESLGASVYEFIDKAKKANSTILATIVGEAPAEVPEDVGVFVVEKGAVKQKKQKDLL